MPLNIADFFDPQRLFAFQPAISITTVYFLLIVFGAMVVAASIVKLLQILSKGDAFSKRLLQRYFVMSMTMGLLGILLTWFRYERANLLSMRLWLLIWFIITVAWFIYILVYQIKIIPKSREALQKTRDFNKYLPKRK